jgi:lysozyme
MNRILPRSQPKLSEAELLSWIEHATAADPGRYSRIDRARYPVIVVGIRGYYLNTMGRPGVNDRGIYDDAIFIHSPSVFAAFNGNTDPSRRRPGRGRGRTKGMAVLDPGTWFVHRLDKHRGRYLALCQRAGAVSVTRDGIQEDYPDRGKGFGINIHRGGIASTSSEGCQTIPPSQWDTFIQLVASEVRRHCAGPRAKVVVPYVLLDESQPRSS